MHHHGIRLTFPLAALMSRFGVTPAIANTTPGGGNLSSAEFGDAIPGTPNVDYNWRRSMNWTTSRVAG